jgi:hypothetical protein
VLDGNPIGVEDPSSPLRSMEGDDDYDHAIFLHTARPDKAFVMDPLGRGGYQGPWVAKEELRQFASRFVTPSGSPYVAMVRRGQQSNVALLRRTLTDQLRAVQAELAAARAGIATARARALDDPVKAIRALPR